MSKLHAAGAHVAPAGIARLAAALVLATGVLAACGPTPPVTYATQERRLSDEVVAQVSNGMSRDEVRRILGGPARIGYDPLTRQEEWMWRYTRLNIYDMCWYVRFDPQGTVSGTAAMIENDGSYDSFKPC